MLDSIYHMTLRFLWNPITAVKTLYFCHYVRNVVMDVIYNRVDAFSGCIVVLLELE